MDAERAAWLQAYLHAAIPISAAMQISVRRASVEHVVLSAPLAPNINHQKTVFGGSAAAVATLAAWSLVHLRLSAAQMPADLVIMANRMDYDRPITDAFEAEATWPEPAGWPLFMRTLARGRQARILVRSVLNQDDAVAGRFEGSFVAIPAQSAPAAAGLMPDRARSSPPSRDAPGSS